MPKPYSILAAALVASDRSLSTVTLAAPIERGALWPTGESEDWFADSDRVGVFNFEVPFAMEPLATRAPVKTAAWSA